MKAPDRAHPVLRVMSVLVAGALLVDAVVRTHAEAGVSTFGRPPEMAPLWAGIGIAVALALGGARDRLAAARRLTLLLLVCCLFGGLAIPAAPELTLALLGATLLAAAPLVRFGPAAWITGGVLLLTLPSVFTASFPEGTVAWATAILPPAALTLLLPSLFPGARARPPAFVILGMTGLLCAAALITYFTLADGLGLPLQAVLATRLRPLGLHPNLAVPQLVFSLVLGCALFWDDTMRWRGWVLAALLPVVGALAAVQSKTGHLAAVLGLGVLAAGRLPLRAARLVHPVAAVAVLVVLLVPVTGAGEGSITTHSKSMASKAVSFRSAMWELGRDTLAAAPWHGFGPGTTHRQAEFARPSRYDGLPKDDHPHNVVLAVGSAFGWPGLLALAGLLAAGLRRGFGGPLLAAGSTAALLAVWSANGIDMGGATRTLFPALAFVGLAVGEAARGDAERANVAPAARGSGLAVLLAGLVLLPVGLVGWTGRLLMESATTTIDEAGDKADPDDPIAALDGTLGWAGRLRPFDPNVPRLRSRLATLRAQPDAQLDALRAARRLHPDAVPLLHEEALLLARRDPEDRTVDALLEEAVRRDPLGSSAWLRLTDLALVRGHRGDASGALDALVAAIVLNPAAVQRTAWIPASESLRLGLDGRSGTTIPVARVFLELASARAERGRDDPATLLRLRLREVEVFLALEDYERADAACERLLADEPIYWNLRLAHSALAAGDADRALAHFEEIEVVDNFQTKVGELAARSGATELDVPAFEALSAALQEQIPDVTFELGTIQQLIAARQRFAERQLDAERALSLADNLAFARR